MDFISFDPRLITENNFHDDNRPYRYEQNIQEQQNLFTNNDNNNEEDGNNNEEYTPENRNENRNENIVLHTNENNTSEYTTPESTTSAQNASQTEISTNSQFVRISTRVVSPRQRTHDPQSLSPTRTISNNTRNITRTIYDHPSLPSAFKRSNNIQIKQFDQYKFSNKQ